MMNKPDVTPAALAVALLLCAASAEARSQAAAPGVRGRPGHGGCPPQPPAF